MKLTKLTYFWPEKPRLLHIEQPLFKKLSESPDWIAEKKYNGQRLELHYFNNSWQFWGRHGELLKYKPSQEVLDALNSLGLKNYWIFDGELRHNKVTGIQHKLVLWDVFVQEGELLVSEPFYDRRCLLEKVVKISEILDLPYQFSTTDLCKVFLSVIEEDEIEGIVIKNLNGKLNLGRNSSVDSNWMFKVRKKTGRHKF